MPSNSPPSRTRPLGSGGGLRSGASKRSPLYGDLTWGPPVNIGWSWPRGASPTSRMYGITPCRTPYHKPLGGLPNSRSQTSTRSWLSFLMQSRACAASCLRCLPHQRNNATHCGCEHGTDGGGSKSTASTRLSKRASNGSPAACGECNSCSESADDSVTRSPNGAGISISLM